MGDVFITAEVFAAKVIAAHNFKIPGIDKVTNFWVKQITSLHPLYVKS